MANKEKAMLKIQIWEDEINDLKRFCDIKYEAEKIWKGSEIAYNEDLGLINECFKTIKKSLEWKKLTEEEKDVKLKEDKNAEPRYDFTDEQAIKTCELLKPLQSIISKKIVKARDQVHSFLVQVNLLKEQIVMYEEKIKREKCKNFDTPDQIREEADRKNRVDLNEIEIDETVDETVFEVAEEIKNKRGRKKKVEKEDASN